MTESSALVYRTAISFLMNQEFVPANVSMSQGNKRRRHACPLCNKEFARSDGVKRHLLIHSGEKQFSCEECKKRFSQAEHLRKHARVHINEKEKMFTSAWVNRQFLQRSSTPPLRMEPLVIENKVYACTECHKQFKYLDNCKRHMRTHTGEKPYYCSVCNKQFAHAAALLPHRRIHTGEKPYGCSVCQKKFSVAGNMKRHMRIHTGEKPHLCTVCMKHFSQAEHLKKHIKTHDNETPAVNSLPFGIQSQ